MFRPAFEAEFHDQRVERFANSLETVALRQNRIAHIPIIHRSDQSIAHVSLPTFPRTLDPARIRGDEGSRSGVGSRAQT